MIRLNPSHVAVDVTWDNQEASYEDILRRLDGAFMQILNEHPEWNLTFDMKMAPQPSEAR